MATRREACGPHGTPDTCIGADLLSTWARKRAALERPFCREWGLARLRRLKAAAQAGAHPDTGVDVGPWELPKSVSSCLRASHTIAIRDPESDSVRFTSAKCGSRKCDRCAPRVARRVQARLLRTLGGIDPSELVFITLTDARRGSPWDWLGTVGPRWRALIKRLRVRFGGRTRSSRMPWVQVFETHADGTHFHAHVVVHSPELAAEVRSGGWFWRDRWHGRKDAGRVREWRWRGALEEIAGRPSPAHPNGLGLGRLDVRPCHGAAGLAAYLAKLAAELTGGAYKGQRPMTAPARTRLLRSTPRFLARLERAAEKVQAAMLSAPMEYFEEQAKRLSPLGIYHLAFASDLRNDPAAAATARKVTALLEHVKSRAGPVDSTIPVPIIAGGG